MELRYDSRFDTVTGPWSVTLAQGATVRGDASAWAGARTDPFAPVLVCEPDTAATVRPTHLGGVNARIELNRLQGTFFFFSNDCPPLDSGTIDLTRQ